MDPIAATSNCPRDGLPNVGTLTLRAKETTPMKLYSGPLSLFTAKVRIALAEKALDVERISVGWSLQDRYLPHHPEVVRLNPKAEVPVLVDGETVVYDSTVILEYLEDAYPAPALYPRSAKERAQARQLEAAADEIFFPNVWSLIEESFYPEPEGGRDAGRLEAARASLRAEYDRIEAILADRDTLCVEGFSVADIGWVVMVNAARTLGAPPDTAHTAVREWLERMGKRPAVAAEMAETGAFVSSLFATAS
jgi:glutathione S-transferase